MPCLRTYFIPKIRLLILLLKVVHFKSEQEAYCYTQLKREGQVGKSEAEAAVVGMAQQYKIVTSDKIAAKRLKRFFKEVTGERLNGLGACRRIPSTAVWLQSPPSAFSAQNVLYYASSPFVPRP